MKFKEAKKILKAAGVKLIAKKDWEGTIRKEYVQQFLLACRNEDMCSWSLVFPEGKKIVNVKWNK